MRASLLAIAMAACSAPSEVTDAAGDGDGPAVIDLGAPDGGGSRCTISGDVISCSNRTLQLQGIALPRTVRYQLPLGTPPASGWPVVFYFQGSFFSTAFEGTRSAPFGLFNLVLTIKALLDSGFAVLAPEANSSLAWQTNIPPWDQNWPGCSDDVFLQAIFAAIAKGDFGPLDGARLHAMGISSGGFMTSRMAVSYAGKFRSLVVHSASYATCSAWCTVPKPLPADHAPTLFLHGRKDATVPESTMEPYRDELLAEGRTAGSVIDEQATHMWIPAGPTAIPAWFWAHP